MNDNKMHGRVLKKLREERGYKLKDVAGDVISTRTLMRFEADETSISISIFEKLLDNLNINYLDYFTFYLDNTDSETTEFANKLQKLLQSGSSSKLVNECKKELKKKDIDFSKRLTILIYLNNILWDKDKELFEENRRLIKDRIDSEEEKKRQSEIIPETPIKEEKPNSPGTPEDKNPEKPGEPGNEQISGKEKTPGKLGDLAPSKLNNKPNLQRPRVNSNGLNTLPNTGESQTGTATVAGLVALAVAARLRKNKENN